MNVVMLHSIGNNNSSWSQNWLSVSIDHFDNFCKFLKVNDYETLFLNEWYLLQNNPKNIHKKQIIITLDDGYLDNWIYAFPILKKYKLKGTIFINPEFVDNGLSKRYNQEDILNKKNDKENLETLGFLNWEEIKYMEKTEFIDIQSHSMSHNYYFKSDKIIDFYNGQEKYHWLSWIINPDQKPYWLTRNLTKDIPFGYPVFEYGRALGLRKFIPSEDFVNLFISEYNEYKHLSNNIIQKKLNKLNEKYKKNTGNNGEFETEEEQKYRYKYELLESKNIIESKLNKKVDFLCWPGGGYNELSINISKEVGYKASTVASSDQISIIDNSINYKRIRRFGLGSFSNINNNFIYNNDRNHLVHLFRSKCGNIFYDNLMRIKKIRNIIKLKLNHTK